MSWPLAMLCALVLMLAQRAGSHWPKQKLRVWSVMTVSWIAGVFAVVGSGRPDPVLAFTLIDITAAFGVLMFHPRSLAQKLIGCLYVSMIALHIGYAWASSYFLGSAGYANLEKYLLFQTGIGWLQWVVLVLWSVGDVGKAIGIRLGLVGHAQVDQQNSGAGGR